MHHPIFERSKAICNNAWNNLEKEWKPMKKSFQAELKALEEKLKDGFVKLADQVAEKIVGKMEEKFACKPVDCKVACAEHDDMAADLESAVLAGTNPVDEPILL